MVSHLLKILRESIKAVPAMKYALAIAGLLAVVALVGALKISPPMAVFGTIVTLVLMVAMVIFARLTTTAPRHFFLPVQIMMWAFLVVTVASAMLLFTSTFFQWPRALGELVSTKPSVKITPVGTKEVGDFVLATKRQRAVRDYEGAWNTIGRAAALAPQSKDVRAEQVQVAMAWVRNMHANDASAFPAIVRPLSEFLHLASASATGSLAADIHAHIGHANFLQFRGGVQNLRIEEEYAAAAALDPTNPFAHAMWGHWVIWEGRPLAEAREHFKIARSTGRETEFVRDFTVAALLNHKKPESTIEVLRLADDIRREGGSLDEGLRKDIMNAAYLFLGNEDEPALLAALPPTDHLATFRWLMQGRNIQDNAVLSYFLARLMETTGDFKGAAATYTSLLKADTRYEVRAKMGLSRCEQEIAKKNTLRVP